MVAHLRQWDPPDVSLVLLQWFINGGYRSPPPRSWPRIEPRDFEPPPPLHEGRFSDHHLRRDHHQFDYPKEDFRDRGKFDRPPPPEWAGRDHGRDGFMVKGYGRRPLSPLAGPPPAGRGRWADCDFRERSRSPISGGQPLKDFRRDMGRGRDERREVDTDRISNVY